MNQKRNKCKHFLLRHYRKKTECEFSHDIAICQNHHPTASGGSLCPDTGCTLRHPRLCLHFVNSPCHFDTKCELFHLKEVSTSPPHSLVMRHQQKMESMMVMVTHLHEEVKKLKYKSELMLPTTDDDPSNEKFQPPDPPPYSIQTKPDLKQPPDDPRRTSPDLTNPTATITTSKDAGSDQNTAASLLTPAKHEMVFD